MARVAASGDNASRAIAAPAFVAATLNCLFGFVSTITVSLLICFNSTKRLLIKCYFIKSVRRAALVLS